MTDIATVTATPARILCRCSGTTDKQIQRLLERGVDTLEGISQATGAVSGCGGCETDILELLAAMPFLTE